MTVSNSLLSDFNEKYEFLINNITDVIIETELDGVFTYVSPQVQEIFGYEPKEVIGQKFFSFIHPEDLPTITKAVCEIINSREAFSLEYRVKHKTGNYLQISARGSLVKVEDKLKLIGILRDITKSKRVEQKLIESEEKFRSITEQSSLGIAILQNSTIKYVNEPTSKIYGYSIQEMMTWSTLELFKTIYIEDRAIAMERLQKKQSKKLKDLQSYPYRVHTKSGELKWIDSYSKSIQYQGKNALLATIIDVTERKRAEHELKLSQDNYHLLFNKSPDYIYVTDTEGLILDANQSLLKKSNLTLDDYNGKKIFDFFMEDNHNELMKAVTHVKEGKEIKDLELRGQTTNGEEYEYEINCVPLFENGSVTKILNIAHDVTERNNIERKLRTSELKYRIIFEQAVDSVILIDTESGIVVDFNEQMHETLGYTREEFEKLRIPDFDLMENEEDYKAHLSKVINEDSDLFKTKYIAKNGEIKDMLVNAKKIIIGNKIFLHSIIRDITQKSQLEKQLNEINSLKSELLERTSHELKTPLISIKGFTELLLELHSHKFDAQTISILNEIKQGTERLETIINKLLETSQLESGQMPLNPTREDLSFLIKFCVRNLRGIAETRNHFIKLDIHEKLILKFEKEKIYEVISHLIINAFKYTPPYGEIKIKSDIRDKYIVISVKDNGIGFTKEEKKKLFKKFGKIERYGQGWNIGIKGTGMGLYTTKKILELHGGEIWVQSEGRNKGSKFSFSLPLNID